MSISRKIIKGLSIASALLLLLHVASTTHIASLPLIAVFGGNTLDKNPFDDAPFNRAHWLEDNLVYDGSNRRGSMAQDITRQLRVGMTKQAIYDLLGKVPAVDMTSTPPQDNPPHVVYVSDVPPDASAVNALPYYLGEELAMAHYIDRAELWLYLDHQDRYLGFRIGWGR